MLGSPVGGANETEELKPMLWGHDLQGSGVTIPYKGRKARSPPYSHFCYGNLANHRLGAHSLRQM